MFKTYYSDKRIEKMSPRPLFVLTLSDRSDGKTFNCVERAFDDFIQKGDALLYMRRYREEMKQDFYDSFLNNFIKVKSEKVAGWEFRTEKSGADIRREGATSWERFVYFLPLTGAGKKKSGIDHTRINVIKFDEYIPLDFRYLPREMSLCFEAYQSVDRDRNTTLMHFLGNAIDIFNPFCDTFHIPALSLECDKIKTYQGGEAAVETYVNEEHREMRSESRFSRLVARTDYESYYKGAGALKAYNIEFGKPDFKNDVFICAFKTSQGEGSIFARGEFWIISARKRKDGAILTDSPASGLLQEQYNVRLPGFSKLVSQHWYRGKMKFESKETFHAFEPLLKIATHR